MRNIFPCRSADFDPLNNRKKASAGYGQRLLSYILAVTQNTAAANIVAGIIFAVKSVIANALSGRSGMNKLAVANVDAHVPNLGAAGALGEKHQIADLQFRFLDLHRVRILVGRGPGQGHAKMIEYILCITGAVKAASPGKGVRYDSLDSEYYSSHYIGCGRVLSDG